MNGCKYIQERIDEAEKPDLLPFEVSEHIEQCSECDRFSTERIALRALVAAGTRVNAPINFDAILKAKLADVKDRRSFWWLGSPGFLRLGAATAGLTVMVFAAQYAGLFSDAPTDVPNVPLQSEVVSRPTPITPVGPAPEVRNPSLSPVNVAAGGRATQVSYGTPKARHGHVLVDRAIPAGYMTAEDGGVVLVRGRNGDMDVQMPTVSVGAQPLLYVSAGQRTVRNVGTSF